MPPLILHHYPMSPFAEKMRLVLGFKGLDWRSVTIPSVMPKPDLLALTGGYRRTPVLQVGADVICDTALQCEVLEHLAPGPTLYPAHAKGLARVIAQWAEGPLFWAAMGVSLGGKGVAQLFAGQPPEAAQVFAADRGAMMGGMHPPRGGDAAGAYRSYLRRLSSMLDGQDYLLGAAASVADFAVYHPLWFTRVQTSALADIFNATPAVLAWMDRMAAIGHGRSEPMSATEAIAACGRFSGSEGVNDAQKALFGGSAEPFIDEHRIPLGTRVAIAPESFGTEASEGELIAATRTRLTLARTDARAGPVRVHFPRIGYRMTRADG